MTSATPAKRPKSPPIPTQALLAKSNLHPNYD